MSQARPVYLVKVGEKVIPLEEVTIYDVTEQAVHYNVGGVFDPVGQLIQWLWDQIRGALETMKNTIWGFLVTIKDSLWGLIKPALDAIGSSVGSIFNMVSGALKELGNIGGLIGQIISGLGDLAADITSFFNDLAANIAAIPGMIASFFKELPGMVAGAVKGFIDSVMGAIGQLRDFIVSGISQVTSFIQQIPSMVMGAIQGVAQTISAGIAQLQSFVSQVFQQVGAAVSGAVQTLQNVARGISAGFSQVLSGVQQFFSSVWEGLQHLGGLIQGAVTGIIEGFKTAFAEFQKWAGGALEGLVQWAQSAAGALTGFINAILKFPEWFPRWFTDNIAAPIVGGLRELAKAIWEMIPDWLKAPFAAIGEFFSAILRAGRGSPFDIGAFLYNTFIKPIADAFSAIGAWIWGALPDWLKGGLEAIKNFFEGLWAGFQDFLKDPAGWLYNHVVKPVVDTVQGIGAWIWEHMPDWLKAPIETLGEFLLNVRDAIINFFKDPWGAITGFFRPVVEGFQAFLSDPLGWLQNNLVKPLADAFSAVGSWIWNALPDWLKGGLETLGNFFKAAWEGLQGFLKDPLGAIWNGLMWLKDKLVELWNAAWPAIQGLVNAVWGGLQWLGGVIVGGLQQLASWIWGALRGAIAALGGWVSSAARGIHGALATVFSGLADFLAGLVAAPLNESLNAVFKVMGLSSPEIDVKPLTTGWGKLLGAMLPIAFFPAVVEAVSDDIIIHARPFSVGVEWRVRLKNLVKWLREHGTRFFENVVLGVAIGLGVAYFSGSMVDYIRMKTVKALREIGWALPPPLETLLDAYRRGFIDDATFDDWMGYWGVWREAMPIVRGAVKRYLTETDIKTLFIRGHVAEEKLGDLLKLTGLAKEHWEYEKLTWYELPSDTDIEKMYRKGYIDEAAAMDLFWMRTPVYDWSEGLSAAYVQHKVEEASVPASVSDVIQFAVHEAWDLVAQGVDWTKHPFTQRNYPRYVDAAFKVGLPREWADLYWENHWRLVPPEKLADLYFRGFITREQYLKYLQYHDYRPHPRPGFEQEIVTPWGERVSLWDSEMMRISLYDIPLRIDVRWMLRWGVATAEDLARIVIMRGMQPDWRAKIVVAEWINNLLDERNRLVTTLLRLAENGYIAWQEVENVVRSYTIKGLPPKVEVVGEGGAKTTLELPLNIWLLNPDEVELNRVRVEYEIKENIIKAELERVQNLYVAGEISEDDMKKAVAQLIAEPKLREREVTRIMARKIRDALYYTHRQLLRTIDAICALYEDGYITRDQAKTQITSVASKWLTPSQVEVILKESDYRVQRSLKKYRYKAIINRLRRGVITTEQARNELKKFIPSDEIVDSIIEAEAKVYTISPERLGSMMEYLPVSPDLLKRKLDAVGMPPDEQDLFIKDRIVRAIASELTSLAREYGNDFVDGLITEQEFKKALDDIATLWGQAKKVLGVDWVVLSPDERALFLEIYKHRRMRKLAREAKKKGG